MSSLTWWFCLLTVPFSVGPLEYAFINPASKDINMSLSGISSRSQQKISWMQILLVIYSLILHNTLDYCPSFTFLPLTVTYVIDGPSTVRHSVIEFAVRIVKACGQVIKCTLKWNTRGQDNKAINFYWKQSTFLIIISVFYEFLLIFVGAKKKKTGGARFDPSQAAYNQSTHF